MKFVRILLTILAVAAAAFLAFHGCRGSGSDKPPEPEPGTGPAGSGLEDFPTLKGEKPPEAPATAATTEPPPSMGPDEGPKGTPVAAGAEVPVVIPYRAGTKSRYRVSDGQLVQDRASGMSQWWQRISTVSNEVVAGDGTGTARVRFKVESFRFQTEAMGRRIEFDSAKPDKELLADETLGLARAMNPFMATLGMPLEFALGKGGEITGIEGVEAMNAKYVGAVDALGAKFARDVPDAPTLETLTQSWSETLFPPIGGGTLKEGEARDASFRTTFLERWAAVSSGAMRVTHDDPDAFRVEFKGKTAIEELNRQAKGETAQGVFKCHIISSDDSYVVSWRIDRKSGRLAGAHLHAKYQTWVARPNGVDENGAPNYDRTFSDVERQVIVELLDD